MSATPAYDIPQREPGLDLRGAGLFKARVDAIRLICEQYIATAAPQVSLHDGPVTIAAVGSSLAHAKYLSSLLDEFCSRSSRVVRVDQLQQRAAENGNLIVISQGLSESSHPAVEKQIAAGKGLLITAVDINENGSKGQLLARAQQAGVQIVNFPAHPEYEILIRAIGPFAGFLAAHRIVSSLEHSTLKPIEPADLAKVIDPESISANWDILRSNLLLPNLCSAQARIVCTFDPELVHNIREKFSEGAFALLPHACSVEEYDHGTFFNSVAFIKIGIECPTIILARSDQSDETAQKIDNIRKAHLKVGLRAPLELMAPASIRPELTILFYEMVFNRFIGALIQNNPRIDQLSWPGKGENQNYIQGSSDVS